MDPELVREKLRLIVRLTAEIQAMLPDEPPRPYLVLVKDGDYDVGDDLPNVAKPSRAREGFPILRGKQSAEEAEQATRSARNDLSKEVVLHRIERGQEEREAFFAEEEIRKMPKQFRKLFRTNKVNAHVRRKPNGVYEIRAQINGIKFAASGKLLERAKERFIAKLSERVTERGTEKLNSRMLFAEYMAKWLETVRRPHVKEETYDGYMRTFRNNIEPNFAGKSIAEVSAFDLQDLISCYVDEGKDRTAKKVYQLLKSCLECAVSDGLLMRSPMSRIVSPYYEPEDGVPLSLEEEARLVANLKADPSLFNQAFAFMLYTGIRRGELASVNVADGWVTLISGKGRKGRKVKRRALPISPMLEKVLPLIDVEAIKTLKAISLTHAFKRRFPEHHLHELRHTFVTRAQSCKIPRELVSFWAGHKADSSVTSVVYTHFEKCPEYQIELIALFDYEI